MSLTRRLVRLAAGGSLVLVFAVSRASPVQDEDKVARTGAVTTDTTVVELVTVGLPAEAIAIDASWRLPAAPAWKKLSPSGVEARTHPQLARGVTWRFEVARGGELRLAILVDGEAFVEVGPLALDGERLPLGDFDLAAASRVCGQVVPADGGDRAVHWLETARGVRRSGVAPVAADGSFCIEHVGYGHAVEARVVAGFAEGPTALLVAPQKGVVLEAKGRRFLAGRVVDGATGEPLAGVGVTAGRVVGGDLPREMRFSFPLEAMDLPAEATDEGGGARVVETAAGQFLAHSVAESGEDGAFALELPPLDGELSIVASRQEYAERALAVPDADAESEVLVELEPLADATLAVVDAESHVAVTGASCLVVCEGGGGVGHRRSYRTDDAGETSLGLAPESDCTVTVQRSPYAPRRAAVAPGDALELELTPGHCVALDVRARRDRRPLAGVRGWIKATAADEARSAVSAANGRMTFDGLVAGVPHILRLIGAGSAVTTPVASMPCPAPAQEILMPNMARWYGRVTGLADPSATTVRLRSREDAATAKVRPDALGFFVADPGPVGQVEYRLRIPGTEDQCEGLLRVADDESVRTYLIECVTAGGEVIVALGGASADLLWSLAGTGDDGVAKRPDVRTPEALVFRNVRPGEYALRSKAGLEALVTAWVGHVSPGRTVIDLRRPSP